MVNLYEILHASTYGIYEYMVKIKQPATASTRRPAVEPRGRLNEHSRAL